MAQGWVCSLCGASFAPWVAECWHCRPGQTTTGGNVTPTPPNCPGCGRSPCDGSTYACPPPPYTTTVWTQTTTTSGGGGLTFTAPVYWR